MNCSLTTKRKLEYLTEHFGDSWQDHFDGKSVDAAYRGAVGDTRKSLYCKIDATTKDHLHELVSSYDTSISDYVEMLINAEWNRYQTGLLEKAENLLQEFG